MWQMLALSFTCLGSVVIYLTNKHQRFINKPIPKGWRIVGYFCLLIALFAWLQIHVISAAFFLWTFIISTAVICIPLISLLFNFSRPKKIVKGRA